MAVKDRILIEPPDDAVASFDGKDIISLSGVKAVDLVGSQLSVDQLTPVVRYPYTAASGEVIGGLDFDGIVTSDGYLVCTNKVFKDLRLLPFGTHLLHSESERVIEKMYIRNVERIARDQYKINSMSGIGLLDTQKHYGNVYRGEFFPEVLADIIGGAFEYTVADELATLQVYGYLPYAFRRANLHQLLFASGVMVAKDDNGDPLFKFLSNKAVKQIPDGRIYMGGSVDYSDPASAVEVTEHSFIELPTDEVVVEYDNTGPTNNEMADHTLLVFRNAPLHDLETTGTLVIEESGVNYAIITGAGILTGKKYTHSTRVMTRYAENAANQRENVKTVADCTLVTVANSENVVKRVLSYYSSKKTVSTAIVVDGEKPGDLIAGKDPYSEKITGFIASMETVKSKITKANLKVITDYIPTGGGNNYTQSLTLTGEGDINWDELLTDKDDDDTVQLQLISGGHGGYSGEDGGDGTAAISGYGTPGEGGEGGAPGEGGKVLTITFKVSELRGLISHYNCGEGGESDQEGGETTILGRSSSEGAVTPYGVANLFTGEVYGSSGAEKGIAGGAGSSNKGEGPSIAYRGRTWSPGVKGSNYTRYGYTQEGGYGGGAAAGVSGNAGEQGAVQPNPKDPDYYGEGGKGGDGASPAARDASTVPGGGGKGGHGGGGAGIGGRGTGSQSRYSSTGLNGKGGKGGLGGKGGPGCINIYF